jgi:antitoxin component of MazEF toxin-antitoxin module
MLQHLQRQGDHLVLVIEPALAEQAGLNEQSEVDVAVAGKTLVVAPLVTGHCNAVSKCEAKEEELMRRLAE